MRSFIIPFGNGGTHSNAPIAETAQSITPPLIFPMELTRSMRMLLYRTTSASEAGYEARTSRNAFSATALTGSAVGGEFVSVEAQSKISVTPWQDITRATTASQAITLNTRNRSGSSADPIWAVGSLELIIPDDSVIFCPMVTGGTATAGNAPIPETEIANYRHSVDLTGCTEVYASAYVSTIGAAGTLLKIQYSNNGGGSWNTLASWDVNANRFLLSDWAAIPGGMAGSVILRLATESGNGAADPAFANVLVIAR